MIEWLAIVSFCLGEKCGFWANTERPYLSENECRKNLNHAENWFRDNGAQNFLSACIQLRWAKT